MATPYTPGDPLTCQEIRELDVLTIEHVGIPGLVLMENAARAVAEFIHDKLVHPHAAQALLLCGPGNNGGDGFVVARYLRNAGVRVAVALACPASRYQGDAAINLGIYLRMEGEHIDAATPDGLAAVRQRAASADVIVDALLGTGSRGAPTGLMAELVRLANAVPRCMRVAVDIPTGLNADTGEVSEPCFRADATITFVAPKVGFAAPAARRVLGRVVVADIGVPRELIPGRKDVG